jgi:hypothetical protein
MELGVITRLYRLVRLLRKHVLLVVLKQRNVKQMEIGRVIGSAQVHHQKKLHGIIVLCGMRQLQENMMTGVEMILDLMQNTLVKVNMDVLKDGAKECVNINVYFPDNFV